MRHDSIFSDVILSYIYSILQRNVGNNPVVPTKSNG
jgi:hypothetical protein